MRIDRATIQNFKALKKVDLKLANFNVIVGPNGSGKSSILQALHWMVQSVRHPSVEPNSKNTGSTLSESSATYMPSPDYTNSGHEGTYGNKKETPQLDVKLWATDEEGSTNAEFWLKAARNEGVSVQAPSNNRITTAVRGAREFSVYIPGLAGIPLSEEKRAKSIVLRQAAAGDANTVLRNVLWLLSLKQSEGDEPVLTELQQRVSRAIRPTEFRISFDEEKDFSIKAEFKTDGMTEWRALELAGIGFLQSIQIFAYIVYFKPRLLLIDEPDSHLHPDAQARLISEIASAAAENDCQVIVTTHSPNVMRALPDDANVVWMKKGEKVENSESARSKMGWGILDKELVLLTEDSDTDKLRLLLSQWPKLERKVAIWPLGGCGNLPKGAVLNSLQALFGNTKTLLHRDGDMMLDDEKTYWVKEWGLKNDQVWITKGADIESYFVCPNYVHKLLAASSPDKTLPEVKAVFQALEDRKPSGDFEKKREDARKLYPKGADIPGNKKAFKALQKQGIGFVRKKATGPLKAAIQREFKGRTAIDIGQVIPTGVVLAPDLKQAIELALRP